LFANEFAAQVWAEKAMASSFHLSMLFLAALCGAMAGMINFPLIGFSRSISVWNWLSTVVLCAVSWIVAIALYASF
jgi:hypothetical protein